MMEVLSNKSAVNKLISNKTLAYWNQPLNSQLALLIHNSVLPDILEHMKNEFGVDFKYDSRPFTLHVGEMTFDVTLVFVTVSNSKVNLDFYSNIDMGQLTKYWEYDLYKRKTLYIDLDQYHILEKFIKMRDLEKSIIDIVVEPGINTKQNQIKIVTFSEDVDYSSLVEMFSEFLKTELIETDNNRHYYINYAFDFLQPTRLSQLNKSLVNERFFFGLHMFLDCLREDTLNILDLCSMKLAFCELNLKCSFHARLEARIDDMITTLLIDAVCDGYIQDKIFDLHGYAEKQNLNLNNFVSFGYFMYTFQNHFKSIKLDSSIWDIDSVRNIKLKDHPQDLLLELRKNPNITYSIDAEDFSGMNPKLLSSILQCGNVEMLYLNGKTQWFNSNDLFVTDVDNIKKLILLYYPKELLTETFIKSFNSMADKRLNIVTVPKINFTDITLTSSVLEKLMEWNFYGNHLISFYNAKIVNDVHTWLLFIRFNFNYAEIIEEEDSFQNFFEAIVLHLNHLREQNGGEFGTDLQFQLDCLCQIYTINDKEMVLNLFKFTIDESNAKLEIKDINSNRQIDLFDLKNDLVFSPEEEDGSYYEFYQ